MRIPKYTRHATGQGKARVDGKDFYFGPYEDPESKRRYQLWLASYLEKGVPEKTSKRSNSKGTTIGQLIKLFQHHLKEKHTINGKPRAVVWKAEYALRPLLDLFGGIFMQQFDVDHFEEMQSEMIDRGWSRSYINEYCSIVKRMFKWAGQKRLLPMEQVLRISNVPNLKKGETDAKEPAKVMPVPIEDVEKTLKHLRRIPAAMVRVQLLCAMRPGEVCMMRPCDIDRSTTPWVYTPHSHKNQFRGMNRVIAIGPMAREILQPFIDQRILEGDEEGYLFSPAEAIQEAAEETGLHYSAEMISPQKHYTTRGYSQAVTRAARRAKVHDWSTNQLRHSRATELRKLIGIEKTSAILGHSNLPTTEIYAERDLQTIKIMAEKYG